MRVFLQTYTGVIFNLLDIRPEMVKLIDIAHALARINRFLGHTPYPYSVAQHSVLMSRQVEPELAFEALLHDAHEAYVGDMPSPMKKVCLDYCDLEDAVEAVVREKFGLPGEPHPGVKEADRRMLVTEQRQLCYYPPREHWGVYAEPYDIGIVRWTPEQAETRFLESFFLLHRARKERGRT